MMLLRFVRAIYSSMLRFNSGVWQHTHRDNDAIDIRGVGTNEDVSRGQPLKEAMTREAK